MFETYNRIVYTKMTNSNVKHSKPGENTTYLAEIKEQQQKEKNDKSNEYTQTLSNERRMTLTGFSADIFAISELCLDGSAQDDWIKHRLVRRISTS